jgi:BCD family chlorophyll transporter-like MFS transporter
MPATESQIEAIAPPAPAEQDIQDRPFSLGRVIRLSTFQIGSAMADIFTAGVWNRIMISDFNIPAWPVGLLLALRYFMAPVSLWVGHRSDTRPLWGWHRTSYVWLGRGVMVLTFPIIGASTILLEQDSGDPLAWILLFLCFLAYGLGTLISGSPYLALVRDSAPKSRQGIAIGVVETVLIAMFPVAAIGFGRLLTNYDPALFWRLILIVMALGGSFWGISVAGAEKANRGYGVGPAESARVDLRRTFGRIWQDRRTRRFFVFLFVATFSAWLQDNILEPYGAEVFGWEVGQTTRLTGYWGTATVVVLVASFLVWRKRPPETLSPVAQIGLLIMASGMAMLVISAIGVASSLFLGGLVIFGAGFGLYTFGGLSLMAVMSPDPHSGAYLGLWTVAILVSKGLGTFIGGVIRDLMLVVQGEVALAYGVAFGVSAAGLIVAALLLIGLDIVGFARERGQTDIEPLPLASIEM